MIGLLDINKMFMGLIYGKSSLGERECSSVVKRMRKRVGPSSGGNEKENGAQ